MTNCAITSQRRPPEDLSKHPRAILGRIAHRNDLRHGHSHFGGRLVSPNLQQVSDDPGTIFAPRDDIRCDAADGLVTAIGVSAILALVFVMTMPVGAATGSRAVAKARSEARARVW
jgi:hypothetical protein